MKSIHLLYIFLFSLLIACSERTSQETNTDTLSTAIPEKVAFDNYSSKFKKIIKTEEGILRGVNFGDKLDEEEDEITDVLYFFDEKRQIKGFRLDIYLNNPSAVDSLSQEFTTYFTDRYGKPVMQEQKAVAWNGLDETKIVMKDVGIKEAPGLQIQIARNM
jgi:hypothetical protein